MKLYLLKNGVNPRRVRIFLAEKKVTLPIEEFDSREARLTYVQALRAMTPEQRLLKALELSDIALDLFKQGLRARFPELNEEAFATLLRERLDLCNNRNY